MSTILADYQAIAEEIVPKLKEIFNQYEQKIKELYTTIDKVPEYYRGTDSEAFIDAATRKRQSFVALKETYDSYADFLRNKVAPDFSETQTDRTNAARQL